VVEDLTTAPSGTTFSQRWPTVPQRRKCEGAELMSRAADEAVVKCRFVELIA
jgi:hypothetical protein